MLYHVGCSDSLLEKAPLYIINILVKAALAAKWPLQMYSIISIIFYRYLHLGLLYMSSNAAVDPGFLCTECWGSGGQRYPPLNPKQVTVDKYISNQLSHLDFLPFDCFHTQLFASQND